MITLKDASLKGVGELLDAGLKRWNQDNNAPDVSLTGFALRHVVPEKQEVYMTITWTHLNPRVTLDENAATDPVPRFTDVLQLVPHNSLLHWLLAYFEATEMVDLTVQGSAAQITVITDDKPQLGVALRGNVGDTLMTAIEQSDGSTQPFTRFYTAPLGLEIGYDRRTRQLTYTLHPDVTQQLLADASYQNAKVTLEVNYRAIIRLELMDDMQVAFLKQLLYIQRGLLQDAHNRFSSRPGYWESRLGVPQQVVQHHEAWLCVALREAMPGQRFQSTQDRYETRALERLGEPPIHHTPRAGEHFGFQRSYDVAGRRGTFFDDASPRDPSSPFGRFSRLSSDPMPPTEESLAPSSDEVRPE